jgi:hypothetical protein
LAARNRSFASIYGNLQRVAHEQQPPGFCRPELGGNWGKLVVFVVVFGYQRTRKIMDMTKIIEILYDNNQLSVILGMMIL